MSKNSNLTEEQLADISAQVAAVLLPQIRQQFEELAASIREETTAESRLERRSPNRTPQGERPYQDPFLRNLKIEYPRFDGHTQPDPWLFKIEHNFNLQQVPEDKWVPYAAAYLEGIALGWYESFCSKRHRVPFVEFAEGLRARFSTMRLKSHRAELFKLFQTASVQEYLNEFDQLSSKTRGLDEEALIDCFISGLRLDIQSSVCSHQPRSLSSAIHHAKLQESRIQWEERFRTGALANVQNPWIPSAPNRRNVPPVARKEEPRVITPVVRLSSAEEQRRREQGLCFRCDERWSKGHICRNKRILLIQGTAEEDQEDEDQTQEEPEGAEKASELSIHALSGAMHPETIQINGNLYGRLVRILIDPGSTHTFINSDLIHKIRQPIDRKQKIRVTVASGENIPCEGLCWGMQIKIEGMTLNLDLYAVPLGENGVILGVQWIRPLGDVILNFEEMTFKFKWAGSCVTWKGIRADDPNFMDLKEARRASKGAKQIAMIQVNHLGETPEEIQELLLEYADIFEELVTLPETRECQHRIPLKDPNLITRVRPYRYPQFQKQEMEKQVRALLEQGLIRHSRSAFSSPALLVKKNSGEWRLCVDYRQLNKNTQKDNFPMPIIDELLQELGGASWFTKIDLRSGFHQIRMLQADVEKTAFRTHDDHYEFLVMQFGLCNAPSTFQALMNEIFRPNLRKYANHPALLGIELLNEPSTSAVPLDVLVSYYTKGYQVVRMYSSKAYVIICQRIGNADPMELYQANIGSSNLIVDLHYYNLFDSFFNNLSAVNNIQFIYKSRDPQVKALNNANGPLLFIGEWTNEWNGANGSLLEYQEYGRAQLDVYNAASFGWSYWTLKCAEVHWDFEWSVRNNYLILGSSADMHISRLFIFLALSHAFFYLQLLI